MLRKNLKKYVVFQIWGNDPLFLIGLIENVKLSPQIYPKWKIRIYYNDVPDHWLLRIKKYPVELIKETFNKKIKFQIWRILPLFDKKVDIFICRDADSRINYREKAAVDNWLESEKPLHIMRDHPRGHKSIILAGMCGFNNRVIRKTIKLKDSDLIHKLKLNDRDTDQEFLRKVIFPFFAHNHIAHDKYNHNEDFYLNFLHNETRYKLYHLLQEHLKFPLLHYECFRHVGSHFYRQQYLEKNNFF